MEIEGTIKKIMEEQVFSEKFKKREFVIRSSEQYPQDIIIEFTNDKCEILNLYKNGDHVRVSFDIRGRQWISPDGKEKYFITLQAWRIESLSPGVGTSPKMGNIEGNFLEDAINHLNNEADDDLPF